MPSLLGSHKIVLLLSALVYAILAYAVPRAYFEVFIGLYALLFGGYAYLLYSYKKENTKQLTLRQLLLVALGLRLVFLGALPSLSDDFWRYLWDGRLLAHGYNPYQYLPSEINQLPFLTPLFDYLNSPDFYSVYPPVMQLIFGGSTLLFSENVWLQVITMRLLVIGFEMGTIYLLWQILGKLQLPKQRTLLYALNPLIIIELTGNLHSEYAMIFFMTLTIYLLLQERIYVAAVAFSGAILTKLIPLVFMPLLFNRFKWKKGILFCVISLGISIVAYLPMMDWALFLKIRAATALYFSHFEFNASVYYLLRYVVINEYWWVWEYHDYFRGNDYVEHFLRLDLYAYLRKLLPLIEIVIIFLYSFRKKVAENRLFFLGSLLWIYSLHIWLATTVHPWYIAPLILFGTLTPWRYAIVWSFLIGGTYLSYYQASFEESTTIIVVEYGILLLVMAYEFVIKQKLSKKNET